MHDYSMRKLVYIVQRIHPTSCIIKNMLRVFSPYIYQVKQIGTISDHLILWNSISEESHRSIGHFELSLEAGSILFPIAPLDCFEGRILIQFPAQLSNGR